MNINWNVLPISHHVSIYLTCPFALRKYTIIKRCINFRKFRTRTPNGLYLTHYHFDVPYFHESRNVFYKRYLNPNTMSGKGDFPEIKKNFWQHFQKEKQKTWHLAYTYGSRSITWGRACALYTYWNIDSLNIELCQIFVTEQSNVAL